MFKIGFYVPETHLEHVKAAVFATGAGKVGDYDHCCWQALGEGQFRPLAGSNPFVGELGEVEKVEEYRVELVCTDSLVANAVAALVESHPYEEPAYDVVKLEEW